MSPARATGPLVRRELRKETMRERQKLRTPFRWVMLGASIGSALGIFACWPWEAFVGVGRPLKDLMLPLVPLTLSFTLLGAMVGAILSWSGDAAGER